MNPLSLDRFEGATLGAYIGETLQNQPLAPKVYLGAAPRARFLGYALDRPSADFLLTKLDPAISREEGILFAILPDILRWYEQPTRWQDRLETLAAAWSLSSEAIADGTLWGRGIALLLQGRSPLDPPLVPPLETVRSAIESDRSLLDTCRLLARSTTSRTQAIAISLQACLQTPGDFCLGVRRAYWSPCQQPVTTILTGIGSGLYNGLTGCPTAWRLPGQSDPLWQEIAGKTRELHALWSGVDPSRAVSPSAPIAIAPAGTIQPRAHFQPIARERL